MKLDSGEILELDIEPNKKILVIWFLTKTITYSVITMIIVFTLLFSINAINLVSEIEQEQENKTEQSQSIIDTDTPKEKKSQKFVHPFAAMAESWGWVVFLIVVSALIIQIYLHFLRKTYRYIITNRRCIFVGGILKRIERTVPYKKITDIQRSQNIIERMLGIWNVQIFTPGTASMQIGQAKARAELNFDGLINSEELYEAIIKHTQLN